MKYLSVALAMMLAVSAPSVEAKDDQPNQAGFSGFWVYAGDSKEEQKRRQAIDAVTRELPSFARGTARKRLNERTAPPLELKLEVEGDRVDISRDGNTVSLRLGAKPVRVERSGQRSKVSVRFDGEQIVVVSEGDKVKSVTQYRLSPDHKRLTMSVRMTGERLSGPLVFQWTFLRN